MLKRFWEGWKRFAHRVGNAQARILLTLIYFVFVLPFGLAVRWWADPLRIKRSPAAWLDRPPAASTVERAHRQW